MLLVQTGFRPWRKFFWGSQEAFLKVSADLGCLCGLALPAHLLAAVTRPLRYAHLRLTRLMHKCSGLFLEGGDIRWKWDVTEDRQSDCFKSQVILGVHLIQLSFCPWSLFWFMSRIRTITWSSNQQLKFRRKRNPGQNFSDWCNEKPPIKHRQWQWRLDWLKSAVSSFFGCVDWSEQKVPATKGRENKGGLLSLLFSCSGTLMNLRCCIEIYICDSQGSERTSRRVLCAISNWWTRMAPIHSHCGHCAHNKNRQCGKLAQCRRLLRKLHWTRIRCQPWCNWIV